MLLLALWLLTGTVAGQNPPASSTAAAPVTAEACSTCHEDITAGLKRNPHRALELREKEGKATCEFCHGAAAEHLDTMDASKILSFKNLRPQKTEAVCLDCHKADRAHQDRFANKHSSASVSCTSCHSVHQFAPRTRLLKAAANDLCASCHQYQRAQFTRPFAHKVPQGKMQCVDCHAPHGSSAISAQLVTVHGNQTGCLTCHSDKRGPFAFEHLPTKLTGCATCHEPHGSSNPRMLIRHEIRQVCLECHTNSVSAFGKTPPAFHDLRSPRFANCTTCHSRIHGSHTSPQFLR